MYEKKARQHVVSARAVRMFEAKHILNGKHLQLSNYELHIFYAMYGLYNLKLPHQLL